jgi:cytochrome b subunit of formate dehydrogenase
MMRKLPLIKIKNGEKYYLKITGNQKIQHYFIMSTFLILVATGFPLKFHYYGWAGATIDFFGGLHVTRTLHRIAGVTMVAQFFYHWYYLFKNIFHYYVTPARKTGTYSTKELLQFMYYSPMCPRKKDWDDIVDFVKFVTFISDERPHHERFHWREKFDYWAVFWGIPVLGITGAFLWFPVWATSFLPGWAINISYIAHSDEAMLAVSVIFIWHMYNAHVNYDKFPMSPLFITGYLPDHLMKHEYYVEWARINKITENDPSLIADLDAEKKAQELSYEQKLQIIRDQIAFLKGAEKGGE